MTDNLYWCYSNNFGDKLSPILYTLLSGKQPTYVDSSSTPKFVSIGSILNHAKAGDTVWGSGLARRTDKVKQDINITAVRGPLTREICERQGVECPDVYGDPGLILPRFFHPSLKKAYKLGIIPHVVDYKAVKLKYKPSTIYSIIDLTQDIDTIIKSITECEYIVSSSLHGLIAADAYNIPNAWCKFSNRVLGDGTKFQDHMLSVDRGMQQCLDLSTSSNIKYSPTDIISIITDSQQRALECSVDNKLLQACPFNFKHIS